MTFFSKNSPNNLDLNSNTLKVESARGIHTEHFCSKVILKSSINVGTRAIKMLLFFCVFFFVCVFFLCVFFFFFFFFVCLVFVVLLLFFVVVFFVFLLLFFFFVCFCLFLFCKNSHSDLDLEKSTLKVDLPRDIIPIICVKLYIKIH